jgi:GT2 family glycosyltransferase
VKVIGHVTVCIVAFRNPEDIIRCLDGLDMQTFRNFEVVICENGGAEAFDRLQVAIRERRGGGMPITCISDQANPGYAGGVNRCLSARPDADAYWVLNPDTVPEANALAELVDSVVTRKFDAVGGPLLLPNGEVQTCGGVWIPWIALSKSISGMPAKEIEERASAIEGELNFVSGASLLVTKRFVETVGLMREDYFLYGEEVEWCLRARKHGLLLGFSPRSRVMHMCGTTTGSGADFKVRARLPIHCDERNRILTLRDTASAPLAVVGGLGAFLTLFWRYGRRRAWRSLRFALAGWWDGICNRRGKPSWLVDV